jgi:uncharacterized phage protein (TIGR02218 family)
MRSASTSLITHLNAIRQSGGMLIMPDGYAITFRDGTSFYATNADLPVSDGTNTYLANSILIDGLRYKCEIGTQSDQQQVTISAQPSFTLNGVAWLTAIKNGILDGAFITRTRIFLNSWSEQDRATPIGTVLLFKGRVGTIDQIGRTAAKVTVNSDLVLLDIQMPRRLYAPNCPHVLYDSGCGLAKANYIGHGVAQAGSTQAIISWSGASSNYTQGRLIWNTGANAGISCNIKSGATGSLTLSYPLDIAPSVGDTFTAYWGCDHTKSTCQSKFNNLANFRGMPFIPPPTYLLG